MRALLLARCLEHEHAVPHRLLHPHSPAPKRSNSNSRASTTVIIDITGDSDDEAQEQPSEQRSSPVTTTDPPPTAAAIEPLFRLHPRRALFYRRLLRLVSLGACPSDPPALLGPQVRKYTIACHCLFCMQLNPPRYTCTSG